MTQLIFECAYKIRLRSSHLLIVLMFFILSGCASGLPLALQKSLATVVPLKVDFIEIEFYADRANAAYDDPILIRQKFPRVTRIATVKSVDVRYFIETNQEQKTHTISIRGTTDKPNIWQDIEISLVKDSTLGINLHRGFRDDSQKVYADLKPYLNKNYAIRVTGHSLGGAIAMIVARYLEKDSYIIKRLVTFGQPKITDAHFKGIYDHTIRVAHDQDVVPMMPPITLAHKYIHLGPELILLTGPDYVYLKTHDAERLSIGQFWRNLSHFSTKEHHMASYLKNIQGKIKNGANQVAYFRPS
jgi:triacylglycerol lipase